MKRAVVCMALQEVLSQLETLSTLFGCVIHDVDHPGFTNTYLINTGPCPLLLIVVIDVQVSLY